MKFNSETIAGMKIVRLIGKGGMSEVYEAEDVRLGIRRAVKVHSYTKDSEEIRRRFEVEGRLLAKLNHPRIVKVTDYGVDANSGRPYFVMDLVQDADGKIRSLADIRPGDVDESVIGRWYDDIREGLAYVHGKGVVHRDLKLQNVLIGPDGHAVITDFGISRIFDPSGSGDAVVNPVETLVNLRDGKKPLMGSVGYMAPEVEMGAPATDRSDWYALGVIVYRLLTGTWCDSRTDVVGMLSTYDPVWTSIITGLLHANPEGRRCLSFSAECDRIRSESELRQECEIESVHRRMRMVVAVCACLVAVCTAGMFFSWRQTAAMARIQSRLDVPCFDSVFAIPKEASAEGTDEMPSVEQFNLAFYDALALTHGMFADLRSGAITVAKAQSMLKEMARRAENDEFELFSSLPDGFTASGETLALSMLLESAVKRLK